MLSLEQTEKGKKMQVAQLHTQTNIHRTAQIHPTSVVSATARIAANVKIGPFCVIGDNVELAENVELKSHVVVDGEHGGAYIGAGTKVYPFAVIGMISQDMKYYHSEEATGLTIGKNNIIREHVTIHMGTPASNGTVVGNNNLFMVGVHIAHDCKVGNNIYIANNTPLAGEVEIDDFAIIGGNSAIQQFVKIGKYAFVGGMTAVDQDILPYSRAIGARPATWEGLNVIGLRRKGFTGGQIETINEAYRILFSDLLLVKRIEALEVLAKDAPEVQIVLNAVKDRSKHSFAIPRKK
ncbi:MAG: acyl-ACP--UDP-N-acetylglucosamine O-acyltransferase [Alphaproteobacteria bacterium]|nr:acyl-ACP--UDP-N-acetylglucosamine O-acyltransferase [Alphaproteobacteria bacterium]